MMFTAVIDAGCAATPDRQEWALRSAVALGAGSVRFAPHSPAQYASTSPSPLGTAIGTSYSPAQRATGA